MTIGESGSGARNGVPVLGDRVSICANAVVAGRITVGDGARISACSLAIDDVEPGTTVRGVPATKVDYESRATEADGGAD